MAAALAAKVSPFGLFETRRLMGAVVGIIGLAATWRLGRRLGGPLAGLSALALLAACPLFYGHMFINAKDAPFAAAMAVLLLALVRAIEEYPRPSWRSVALVGVALGAAFGSRILAVLAAPPAAAALLLIAAEQARRRRRRAAAARLHNSWARACRAGAGLSHHGAAVAVVGAGAAQSAARGALLRHFFEKPWKELYEGALIAVPDMPASYLPHRCC